MQTVKNNGFYLHIEALNSFKVDSLVFLKQHFSGEEIELREKILSNRFSIMYVNMAMLIFFTYYKQG